MRPLLAIIVALASLAIPAASLADDSNLRRAAEANARKTLDGFTLDAVKQTLDQLAFTPIEGLWMMTDDGARFAIIADSDESRLTPQEFLLMVIVDSPDRSVKPGTVFGVAAQSAAKGVFDALIISDLDPDSRFKAKNFLLKLGDEGRLSIIPVRKGLRINLWRLVPYLFRHSVKSVNNRPEELDGAIKIYPAPAKPFQPRIL